MNKLNWLDKLNPFRKISIVEDAKNRIRDNEKVVAQCEATILHAQIVKQYAETEMETARKILGQRSYKE